MRGVRLIRSFLCFGRVRTEGIRLARLTRLMRSFMFGESGNIRLVGLVRLVRLIRSFLCLGRVTT